MLQLFLFTVYILNYAQAKGIAYPNINFNFTGPSYFGRSVSMSGNDISVTSQSDVHFYNVDSTGSGVENEASFSLASSFLAFMHDMKGDSAIVAGSATQPPRMYKKSAGSWAPCAIQMTDKIYGGPESLEMGRRIQMSADGTRMVSTSQSSATDYTAGISYYRLNSDGCLYRSVRRIGSYSTDVATSMYTAVAISGDGRRGVGCMNYRCDYFTFSVSHIVEFTSKYIHRNDRTTLAGVTTTSHGSEDHWVTNAEFSYGGDWVFVAYSTSGTGRGFVLVYEYTGGTDYWTYRQRIDDDSVTGGRYGLSMSYDSVTDQMYICDPYQGVGFCNEYKLQNNVWTKINKYDGQEDSLYGKGVSSSGGNVLFGSEGTTSSVYFYETDGPFRPTDSNFQTVLNEYLADPIAGITNYGHISTWQTFSVTNMGGAFSNASTFNEDISSWDVSNVLNMSAMFQDAVVFDQDISIWDTSGVTDMSYMFNNAVVFDQDISIWDTSGVTDMSYMFNNAAQFNQDISIWDTSGVTDMSYMLAGTDRFNYPIGSWDTSSVTDMSGMFNKASSFSNELDQWDTSLVTDMSNMFRFAKAFNKNLPSWDTSNVKNFSGTFAQTYNFRGTGMNLWNVSSLVDEE